MKHQDRAYQTEIEDSVIEYLFAEEGNPVVASPGGTGKSFVMAKLTKRFVTEWPGTRVILLAQDAKLLDQNSEELYRLWPAAPAGIYSAGLKMRDTKQEIIFAGIQSVAKRAQDFGARHIVIVDECDQISHRDETLYQRFITDLKRTNPKLRVIGFTATPYRLGMGCLTNLDMWDKIVIDLTKTDRFNWFVENGFLAPLVTKKTTQEIDVTNVSMKGGEFDAHDLQEVSDTDELNTAVVEECIRYGKDRNHWLVFSSGVKHGHKLAKLFNSRGVPTLMLSGEDSMADREKGEEAFKRGDVRCLVNCGLYGRGWNMPALDLIAWVRATQSTALWVQGTVRGTRVYPGKKDCIATGQQVLTDFGLVSIEKITRKMKVWDGVDFVRHGGIISRGTQPTITYAGLTATPDHKVRTAHGWRFFSEAAHEGLEICATGDGERPLRESDNYFTSGDEAQARRTSLRNNQVRDLWERDASQHDGCNQGESWVSFMQWARARARYACVAIQQMFSCAAPLPASDRQEISRLRWKRNQVPFLQSDSDGVVGSGKPRAAQSVTVGPSRQQWSLRSWKSALFDTITKCLTHQNVCHKHTGKSVSAEASRSSLRRQYTQGFYDNAFDGRADRRAVLPTFVQTEREVWDILNCGPRHSFTCQGLLVHNCVVLDFAGNIRRNGPINEPIIPLPRRKGDAVKGEAPVKECPQCFSYLHTRIMVCPDCGYVFPPPSTIKKTASEDEILKFGKTEPRVEEFKVMGIRYKTAVSKKGMHYLKVTYSVGTHNFNEAKFFDSDNSFAKKNLKTWWTFRGGLLPMPANVEEAIERADSELAVPTVIRVDLSPKYPDVVGCDFDGDERVVPPCPDDDIPF